MNRLVTLFSAALFVMTGGCATTSIRGEFERHGLTRAAFDTGCPEEQLDVWLVNRGDADRFDASALGAQVQVMGCDKQAVYVLVGSAEAPAGWSWVPEAALRARSRTARR